MDPDRGPYNPVPQTQESEIDPRLQEATPNSQPYSNAAPPGGAPSQFRLPPPTHPHAFQQQQHGHQQQHQPQSQQPYGAPPQWPQDGYNPYYAPPDQQPSPITQVPHHPAHAYQSYQDPSATPLHPQPAETNESKRTRACEACRSLKVKCDTDPDGGPCKRCGKANRNCVITAPSRKRQKKTDSRVAELERRIDDLTRVLDTAKEGNVSGSDDGDNGQGDTSQTHPMESRPFQQLPQYSNLPDLVQKRRFSEYQQDSSSGAILGSLTSAAAQLPPSHLPRADPETQGHPYGMTERATKADTVGTVARPHGDVDVIGRGLLSAATANELFMHYNRNMAPYMPVVVFPDGTTSDAVSKTSPILFLAILSVASGQDFPDLRIDLDTEMMRVLADRSIVRGEKSLEIIQALQVIIIWYLPDANKDSKYYRFVHEAAGMAIDLGINKNPKARRYQFSGLHQHNPSVTDTSSIECRRAWLGCYLLYSSTSMGMRRSNLIRFDGYLQSCMTTLSDGAVDSDKMLCRLVMLHTIVDDLSGQILPDDYVTVSETKARNAYKGFEKQFREWQEQQHGNMGSMSLSLASDVVHLYMHELEMQHYASSEVAKSSSRARGKNQSQASPSAQASSSYSGLTATLGILRAFSNMSIQDIRSLPIFFMAQLGHAIVGLIKMYFVAKADPEFSKHTPVTAAMVETLLGQLTESLRLASVDGKSLAAHAFLKMIVNLQTMYEVNKHSTIDSIRARYNDIPSLKGAQILDLEEPQPTPQQRASSRRSGENHDEALHVLSEVATGKSTANGLQIEEGQQAAVQSGPDDDEIAAMGRLVGEGGLGFMNDEGFFGIMQTMFSRATY